MNPPGAEDWNTLQIMRTYYLSAFWTFEWRLTPVLHYMTDHLFTLHDEDRNFFPWLQEGAEHHHQNDRESGRNAFHGRSHVRVHSSHMQQLLEQQELRRILISRGHQLQS